jgi:competence ComEA-like helix-hairpin-helix protein
MFTVAATLSPIVSVVLAVALMASPAVASDHVDKTPTKSTSPVPDDKDHPAKVRAAAPHRTADTHHDEKVNVNTADVKELMTLTGVGRKVAEKIVAYRDSHGPFKKADELRKVDGVGNGLWEKNRERIVTK